LYYCKIEGHPTTGGLDQVLKVWLTSHDERLVDTASIALWTQFGLERKRWTPVLHQRDVEKIKRTSEKNEVLDMDRAIGACLMAAFHAGTVWSDDELVSKLRDYKSNSRYRHGHDVDPISAMLKELKPNRANRSTKRSQPKPRK
jgi:hypothetical protein